MQTRPASTFFFGTICFRFLFVSHPPPHCPCCCFCFSVCHSRRESAVPVVSRQQSVVSHTAVVVAFAVLFVIPEGNLLLLLLLPLLLLFLLSFPKGICCCFPIVLSNPHPRPKEAPPRERASAACNACMQCIYFGLCYSLTINGPPTHPADHFPLRGETTQNEKAQKRNSRKRNAISNITKTKFREIPSRYIESYNYPQNEIFYSQVTRLIMKQ